MKCLYCHQETTSNFCSQECQHQYEKYYQFWEKHGHLLNIIHCISDIALIYITYNFKSVLLLICLFFFETLLFIAHPQSYPTFERNVGLKKSLFYSRIFGIGGFGLIALFLCSVVF